MTIARWEWRGFGEGIGAAERRLAELTPDGVQDSDETYLLSARRDACVKVRDGLLDVKQLLQVSDEGLEQWMPLSKDAFPVDAERLRAALAELGVPDARLDRDAYTLDEVLGEVVEPNADLRAAGVRKTRRRYTLGGCLAELTDIHVEGRDVRTVAIESEDRAQVLVALGDVGASARPNVSVPRGLAALLGFGTRRFAVIDVGTNSVKFLLAERLGDGSWRELVDRSEVTRLGEGLAESERLQPEPMQRTIDAIAAMVDEARRNAVEAIVAVGTAGMRAAENGAELVSAVQERCDVRVEVIGGEEEARLSYLAAISGIGPVDGSLAVFETGGGSTQFTFGHGERIDEQFSVDVGAVRYTERFDLADAVDDETLAAALEAIADDLAPLEGRPMPEAIVAMGGAVTNLAAVKHELTTYDPNVVRGTELTLEELDRQIELYRTRSAEERRAIAGLQPKRADIMLAGACIVRRVLAKLGARSLVVSDRGLRHRLLIERFAGE